MANANGCGVAQCGACTVHVDREPTRSCSLPISALTPGQKIETIEGLAPDSTHALQTAWVALDVPQCGYCQSGQIMAAAALLAERRSGFDFMSRKTQAMQRDDMSNPGMLPVLEGAELWRTRIGKAGKSCADCHDDNWGQKLGSAPNPTPMARRNSPPSNST